LLLPILAMLLPPPTSTLSPYTTLFRSRREQDRQRLAGGNRRRARLDPHAHEECDGRARGLAVPRRGRRRGDQGQARPRDRGRARSEEHTSELQSPDHLVCRLLLEKKKK